MIELEHLATGKALIGLVLTYAVFPYGVLWIVVRCWPKDHPRRAEYLAEYRAVPVPFRPFWVGDAAIRSLTDGFSLRAHFRRSRVRDMQQRVWRIAPAHYAGLVASLCGVATLAVAGWLSHVTPAAIALVISFGVPVAVIIAERRFRHLFLAERHLRPELRKKTRA